MSERPPCRSSQQGHACFHPVGFHCKLLGVLHSVHTASLAAVMQLGGYISSQVRVKASLRSNCIEPTIAYLRSICNHALAHFEHKLPWQSVLIFLLQPRCIAWCGQWFIECSMSYMCDKAGAAYRSRPFCPAQQGPHCQAPSSPSSGGMF